MLQHKLQNDGTGWIIYKIAIIAILIGIAALGAYRVFWMN